MLDIVANQLRKKGINPDKYHMPKHIALSLSDHAEWADRHNTDKHNIDVRTTVSKAFKKVADILKFQTCFDIPIMTVYLLASEVNKSEHFSIIIDELANFFQDLNQNELVFKNKIKVSILGKWYDLPSRIIESVKKIIDETKDFDTFFLNLCINYDGKGEIVDSCRLIGRKLAAGRIDIESIDEEMIKDNLYSSYFLPPDLIIKTGKQKKLNGFLLWDSTHATIYFSNVFWNHFKETDFMKALKYYQEDE